MPTKSEIAEVIRKHPEWKGAIDLIIMPPSPEEIVEEFSEARGSDVLKPLMTSYGVSRGAQYVRMRRTGSTHRFAEMVSCQNVPAIMTDSVFKAGMQTIGQQFGEDPTYMNKVVSSAKAQGYNPRPGDTYFASLARFPGDREAFVPATEGRGYIKKLCEDRGWACEGAVNVDRREPDSDPHDTEKRLAPDIVNAEMRGMAERGMDIKKKDRKELKKQIIKDHGY